MQGAARNQQQQPQPTESVMAKRKDLTAGGANVVDILTMSAKLTLIASYVIRRIHIYHGNVRFWRCQPYATFIGSGKKEFSFLRIPDIDYNLETPDLPYSTGHGDR